jgi:DNA-binding transcriptional regulator GbsR (MarR family)
MFSILEAHYAHVIERLLKAWGSPADFGALYDDLYFDTRPVHRSGWPEDVQEELQLLRKVHELAYETEAEDCATESVDELKWV